MATPPPARNVANSRSGGTDRPTRVRSVIQIASAKGPASAPRNTAVGAIVQLSLRSAVRKVTAQRKPASTPALSQRGGHQSQRHMPPAYEDPKARQAYDRVLRCPPVRTPRGAAGLAVGLFALAVSACTGGGEQNLSQAGRETFCHATPANGGTPHKFEKITTSDQSVINAHRSHSNDIFGLEEGDSCPTPTGTTAPPGTEAPVPTQPPTPTEAPTTEAPTTSTTEGGGGGEEVTTTTPTEPSEPSTTEPPGPTTTEGSTTTEGGGGGEEVTTTEPSGPNTTTTTTTTTPSGPTTTRPSGPTTTRPSGPNTTRPGRPTTTAPAGPTTTGPSQPPGTGAPEGPGPGPGGATTTSGPGRPGPGSAAPGQAGSTTTALTPTTTAPGATAPGATAPGATSVAPGSTVPGGTIPSTGRDTTPTVLFATLLLVLGALAVMLVRRPGNHQSD
jgi:hypothetical protein